MVISGVDEAIRTHIERLVEADNDRLEALLADAVRLQEFDKLDRLCTVISPGTPRTVASLLEPAEESM